MGASRDPRAVAELSALVAELNMEGSLRVSVIGLSCMGLCAWVALASKVVAYCRNVRRFGEDDSVVQMEVNGPRVSSLYVTAAEALAVFCQLWQADLSR